MMDASLRLSTTAQRLCCTNIKQQIRRAIQASPCSLRRGGHPVRFRATSKSTARCAAGNGQQGEPQDNQQLPKHLSNGNGRHTNRHDALPLSLFNPYANLPCDGKTRSEAEEACDPYTRNCQTEMHVWETNCKKCHGSGTVATYGGGRGGGRGRGSRRQVYTCPSCHGIGCVRHTSTRVLPDVNGGNGQYTAGRPPCEITWEDDSGKKKSLFERFKEKLGS